METNDTSKMNDHDLLITMHEQIKGIKEDIKDIKDGTTAKIEDHEKRLRIIEEGTGDQATIKKLVYGSVAVILSTMIGLAIHFFVKK